MTAYLHEQPAAIDMIRLLFRFNDWAFQQMFRAVALLPDDQFRRPGVIAGGVRDGSIYSAIGHTAYNEEAWLLEWMSGNRSEPDLANYATLASMASHLATVNEMRADWLANVSSLELTRAFKRRIGDDGSTKEMPLWAVLFNIPIHTVHYRAEIYEALTRFGIPPAEEPDLIDYVQLLLDQASADAVADQPSPQAVLSFVYDFHDWATLQLFSAVSRVSDSELSTPAVIAGGAGNGSIEAMLSHIVGAERYWLSRWTDTPGDFPDGIGLASQSERVRSQRRAWLDREGSALLTQSLAAHDGTDGVTRTIPLWPALMHVPIHATHHRAEIYQALTSLGYPPEHETHVIFYLEEQLRTPVH